MSAALAGYLAVTQIAARLDLTLPDDIAAGCHVTLGVRAVRPDGRSNHDSSFRWPWPGSWTPHVNADTSTAECSYGLHIALGWQGLSATGPVHVCQIVAYRESDVAHRGSCKIRVSMAAVLDIVDVHHLARDANLRGADLRGAKWRDGVTIQKVPVQIYGLYWPVTVLDEHIQIGCQFHKTSEWADFEDSAIIEMDGRNALRFWRANKLAIIALAVAHQNA